MDVEADVVIIQGVRAIVKSVEGSVVKTTSHTIHNILPNPRVWTAGTEPFQVDLVPVTRDVAKSRMWLVARLDIDSNPGLTIDSIARHLFKGAPEIGAIVEYEPNAFKLVVHKRRNNMSMFGDFLNIDFFSMTPADHHQKILNPSNQFLFLKAILNSYEKVVCNYALTFIKNSDTVDKAAELLAGLNVVDKNKTIARAMLVKESQRTDMEHCIARTHSFLIPPKTETEDVAVSSIKVLVTGKGIKPWESFENAKKQMAWTFNVKTGNDIEVSLDTFINAGWFRTHALVLLGDSSFGKTVAAESMCRELCYQILGDDEEKYFLNVGTVDSLRKVQKLVVEGTPIIFDDVTASQRRGSRDPMEVDMVKHLCTVKKADGADARCGDLCFSNHCARIWTSNAATPNEWCEALKNVRHLAPADRKKSVSSHGKALYKRCMFALVLEPLVEQEECDAFDDALRAEGVRLIGRTGDNVAASDSDSL
jgi:hypothetical protein